MDRGRVLLGGALVSLVGFLTLTAVVTHHGFDGADRLTRAFVHPPHASVLDSSMEAASFLGGQPGQITVVVLGSAMLWRRRRRRWALSLPVIMAGAGVLQLAAKWGVDRPRPNSDPWGFPSAHVLSLVVLLGCIAYLVGTSKARGGYRGFGVIGCAGIVATVAYSRMYLDAHWLSDVLGGVSVGLAYLLVAIWLVGSTPALAEPAVVPAAVESLVASVVESLPGIAAIGEVATDPAVSAMAGLGPA